MTYVLHKYSEEVTAVSRLSTPCTSLSPVGATSDPFRFPADGFFSPSYTGAAHGLREFDNRLTMQAEGPMAEGGPTLNFGSFDN